MRAPYSLRMIEYMQEVHLAEPASAAEKAALLQKRVSFDQAQRVIAVPLRKGRRSRSSVVALAPYVSR